MCIKIYKDSAGRWRVDMNKNGPDDLDQEIKKPPWIRLYCVAYKKE